MSVLERSHICPFMRDWVVQLKFAWRTKLDFGDHGFNVASAQLGNLVGGVESSEEAQLVAIRVLHAVYVITLKGEQLGTIHPPKVRALNVLP